MLVFFNLEDNWGLGFFCFCNISNLNFKVSIIFSEKNLYSMFLRLSATFKSCAQALNCFTRVAIVLCAIKVVKWRAKNNLNAADVYHLKNTPVNGPWETIPHIHLAFSSRVIKTTTPVRTREREKIAFVPPQIKVKASDSGIM